MEQDEKQIPSTTQVQMQRELISLREDVDFIKEELERIRIDVAFRNDALMDSAAVCRFLSISYRQLKIYKSRGEITALYNGSKCLYKTSEVRRFIDEVLMVKGRKTKKLLQKMMQ